MEDDSAEFDPPTLDLPAGGQRVSESSVSARKLPLPHQDWDRYQIVGFIGSGGMATVYKARDPRLNRFVALKFIRPSDTESELGQRFYREARAQAGIEHEHICKIYEVGEVDGRAYIAMQYIEGETLTTARGKMTTEQKVRVLEQVADALHAAHRMGLIHRDIKPGNIMVEPTPEGSYRPYVLDFGLASEVQTSGASGGGNREGTPAYMAPEQARGDTQSIDRRTDVYGLGSTLYDILTGQPPYGIRTTEDTLLALLIEDPKPLRQIRRELPGDLEAIVMKCLEKDPADRYESAKALADDLRRYLDGEPVAARQAVSYRLYKRVVKNRILVGTLGTAAIAIIVLTVIGIQAQVKAAQERRQAQQFGQTIKEIEMFLRFAYALPKHSTNPEKELIRRRMSVISERLKTIQGEAAALAHYALGRGHFVLQELEPALEHLTLAYEGGLHTPEVNYALGRTLGEIYYQKFKDVQRGLIGQRYKEEKQKLDNKYLLPALAHLRNTQGLDVESPLFAQGLLAYYNQQYDEALRKSQEAFAEQPWLFEAKKLQADIYSAYGRQKQSRGQYAEARVDYEQAAALYHEAAEALRSDSTIHGAEADMWVQVMDINNIQGQNPSAAYEQALRASDVAIATDPKNHSAVRKKVWAYTKWGTYQLEHGLDPRDTAKLAINTAEQAIELNPKNAFPYQQIGLAYALIASYEEDHGLGSDESSKKAAEFYNKAINTNQNFHWAWTDLGQLYTARAEWLFRRGQDYTSEHQAGIAALRRAIDANPDYHLAYTSLVDAYRKLASYKLSRGDVPTEPIDEAIKVSERSLKVNPNFSATYTTLALIYTIKAEYLTDTGQDPHETLVQALTSIKESFKTNPNDAEAYRAQAEVYRQLALDDTAHNRSPTENLENAKQAIEKSILISRNSADSFLLQAQLLIIEARDLLKHGHSPLPGLQQARTAAERARELNPKDPGSLFRIAEIAHVTTEWNLLKNLPVAKSIEDGLQAIEGSLALNSFQPVANAMHGQLLFLAAKAETDAEKKKSLAAQAVHQLRQAVTKNPLLQRQYSPLLNEASTLAQ